MAIDSHVHVWRAHPDFPRLTSTIVSPHTAVPAELLDQYLDDHQIDRAVLVQPVYPGEDNGYVADCAADRPERFAAVCVVDPRSADAADKLSYWVHERGCRGLRLRPKVSAEHEIFGAEATFPLWKRAGDLRAVVSVLCGFEHLPTVRKMALRFPGTSIVVDHLAHPDFTANTPADRFEPLLSLADCANVTLKVSGYYYYSETPWPYPDCQPLFRTLLERFDAGRLMWGSDFPHVVLKTTYARVFRALEDTWPGLSKEDREKIFDGNARRLYWW